MNVPGVQLLTLYRERHGTRSGIGSTSSTRSNGFGVPVYPGTRVPGYPVPGSVPDMYPGYRVGIPRYNTYRRSQVVHPNQCKFRSSKVDKRSCNPQQKISIWSFRCAQMLVLVVLLSSRSTRGTRGTRELKCETKLIDSTRVPGYPVGAFSGKMFVFPPKVAKHSLGMRQDLKTQLPSSYTVPGTRVPGAGGNSKRISGVLKWSPKC
eukprot:492721-Rhodomonas_salina.1